MSTGIDWTKEQKTCPKCGKTKPVEPDFGVFKARGHYKPMSLCVACRTKVPFVERIRRVLFGKRQP
jgi:hypothetical protein